MSMDNDVYNISTSTTIPATKDNTVVYFDAEDHETRIRDLESRITSLENDFDKLTAFVNTINNRIR